MGMPLSAPLISCGPAPDRAGVIDIGRLSRGGVTLGRAVSSPVEVGTPPSKRGNACVTG